MRRNHTVTMFEMPVKSCHHMRGLPKGYYRIKGKIPELPVFTYHLLSWASEI